MVGYGHLLFVFCEVLNYVNMRLIQTKQKFKNFLVENGSGSMARCLIKPSRSKSPHKPGYDAGTWLTPREQMGVSHGALVSGRGKSSW